jgi:2-polyprenyl-3-methyl-5-hydroxy-6-metoxy-1,4-benzoquinol methylase
VRYTEQQQFINRSRLWGAAAVALVLTATAVCLKYLWARDPRPLLAIEFGITAMALAGSIYYTPDYLHLTVTPDKKLRWAIKVRWRILATALAFGFLSISSPADALVTVGAITWLALVNLLAKKLRSSHPPLYFWTTDFILLAFLLLAGKLNPLLAAVLLAAAAHLFVVISKRFAFLGAAAIGALSCLLLVPLWRREGDITFLLAGAGLLLVSALVTAFLVHRAQRHNARNVEAAMRELIDFTGYPAERVQRLWSISNQELARNWNLAGLDGSDPARLAQWYRENSELYMFAISAYNLEYKRIRSNLNVLSFARGSCLDYGAGNGEILLELAGRGHAATYYDVEGRSMNFARWRASQRALAVEFLHCKEDLAGSARKTGFDTVFSFDVLEHLPDLPGELNFLSSLLGRGGLLVFDVPAGSTQSHPMHLNHSLDVCAFALAKGLKDERSLLQRLPFRKEEKYFFRATKGRVGVDT